MSASGTYCGLSATSELQLEQKGAADYDNGGGDDEEDEGANEGIFCCINPAQFL